MLSSSLFKKVAVAYNRPLGIIRGAHRPPLDGFVQESNLSVRLRVHALPMEWEIVFSRLRVAFRLGTGPKFVLALVQSRGGEGWRRALQWSLKALSRLLADKLGSLPCPLLRPQHWEGLWTAHPAEWFELVWLGRKRALAMSDAAAVVMADCLFCVRAGFKTPLAATMRTSTCACCAACASLLPRACIAMPVVSTAWVWLPL